MNLGPRDYESPALPTELQAHEGIIILIFISCVKMNLRGHEDGFILVEFPSELFKIEFLCRFYPEPFFIPVR